MSFPLRSQNRSVSRAYFAPVSEKRALPTDVSSFAGTYTNLGYGPITFCSSPSLSPSAYCANVLSDFSSLGNTTADGVLYARWPRLWCSHMRISPLTETTVTVETLNVFPRGYGRDGTAFE